MKKLVYIGEETRIIPGFGVFSKGDTTAFDETLLATGLFEEKQEKKASEN